MILIVKGLEYINISFVVIMIGRIYRIIHLESDICYIGSTSQELRHRWQTHKNHYRHWLDGKAGKCSIYPKFLEHGLDQFKMVLIKEYDIADRKELNVYETLWIYKFRHSCVNNISPFGITKLSLKNTYIENRESKLLYQKKYREENKARITDHATQEVECGCGSVYQHCKRWRHVKSKKHEKWLQNQES